MKIFDAFKRGLSLVSHHRKMVGVIYLVNVCIGVMFALPLFILFKAKVGSLTIRDELVTGFPYSWWSSFHLADGLEKTIRPSLSGGFGPLFDNFELLLTGEFQTFGWFVFTLALAYLFIAAFFNGGAIALFADERKSFSMSRFFAGAGANFHHMAALAATTIAVFALFYKVINPLIFSLADHIVGDSLSQTFAWFVNLIAWFIIIDLVFLLTLILDYAKVIVISDKKDSSWLCIWLSLLFIVKNFFKTVGLNILLVLIVMIFSILGGLLMTLLQPTQLVLLIVVVLVQQTFVFVKIGLRLTFYASETVLYQQQTAKTTPVKKRKR